MRRARRRDADSEAAEPDTESSAPPSDGSDLLGLPAAAPDAVPWPSADGHGWDWRTSELVGATQQSFRRGLDSGRRSVGIDLGSTNSVIAVLEDGVPVIIPNSEGACSTPSAVAFAKGGSVLVGEVARRQAITNPDRTIASVKRHMGTNWLVSIDGKAHNPQEISARTLQKLKRDAEAHLGVMVTQAVLTVPASFDNAQRTATKEAAQVAGLQVLRIISEPAAAALAVGELNEGGKDQTVLVFDLGGGSLSVLVIEIGDGVFEVKATGGDTSLGGDDWDDAVIDWLVATFKGAHGIDLSKDSAAMQRLKEAAETAKVELSQVQQTHIHLPFIAVSDFGPLHLDEVLTRTRFQAITAALLDRCCVPLHQVVKDVGLTMGDLDRVVMVGGCSRMPAVQELVHVMTGREPHRGVCPDEVVAMGAALKAGLLKGDLKDVLLLDVTSLSLGIETEGGVMTKLIERNTTIPTRRTEVFTTSEDDQPSVEIHVLQGEREMSGYNTTLGKFQLAGLAPAPRGVPQVEVTFDIDPNGIINASAKDRATGEAQSLTVTGQSSLSKDQIGQVVKTAQAQARTVANPPSPRPLGRSSAVPEAERTTNPSDATVAAILGVLPAMDACDLAAMHAENELATTRIELVRVLDRLGASRIDAAEVHFDPNLHEAVSHERDDRSSQQMVSRIVRPGYRCGERVLRPALVAVRG